jgi:hypothetical protein
MGSFGPDLEQVLGITGFSLSILFLLSIILA